MIKNTQVHSDAALRNPSELQVLSYASPVVISTMLIAPMNVLQGIYAKHYGIALTTLAFIILCSRLFDAVSDPVIGYYSDRYHTKHGTRKPFMVAGMLLLLVCGYFLYVPPTQITGIYIAFWFIAFTAAYTLFEIPHYTWPCDMVSESADKTKFYSYRVAASYCGLVLFYCIPLLPIFPTDEITPETLRTTFTVAVCLMLPLLFVAMRVVPSGKKASIALTKKPPSQTRWRALRFTVQEILSNKPFKIFIATFLFNGFSAGMWYGLIFIYVDVYLGMGGQFAKMFLIAFAVGIAVSPLWYHVILRFGKKPTFLLTMVVMIGCYLFTGTLNPGETSFTELFLLKMVQTAAFVGQSIVLPVMLSQVIDYAHLKTGVERSATYFSIQVFCYKAANAVGTALGLSIVGWFGFVASDTQFSDEAIWGLKVSIAIIPAVLSVFSLVFMVMTPINERRHSIIKRKLALRLKRSLPADANENAVIQTV